MKKFTFFVFSLVLVIISQTFFTGCQSYEPFRYALNVANTVEDLTDKRDFVIKTDGEVVYGSKLEILSSVLAKNQYGISGKFFGASDIKAYKTENVFFIKLNNDFCRRIIRGKINVYVQFVQNSSTTSNYLGVITLKNFTTTHYFSQKGDNGKFIELTDEKSVKFAVQGCKKAEQLADLTFLKMDEAVKNDLNYINRIFEIYNRNCEGN